MELRNFDQVHEPSSLLTETQPDDSGDVKHEFGASLALTEQGLPKPTESALKGLELSEIDIQTFPMSSLGLNGSKAAEEQNNLQ